MSLAPNSCPALVLNADYQPLSYFPLSTWSWKDALKAVFLDRVNVVSEYNQIVRSPSIEFKLPSVVSLKDYIPLPEKAAFTRFNVFLRDKFICQYCTKTFKVEELTFDHVFLVQKEELQCGKMLLLVVVHAIPKKEIKHLQKLGLKLKKIPHIPSNYELKEIGRMFPPNFLHQS